MDTKALMLFGGFIPGSIALVFLIAAWYIHAFKKSRVDHLEDAEADDGHTLVVSAGPRWVLALMLAVGFAGADYPANGIAELWPDGNNYRFVHAIGLIALVGVLDGLVRLPMLVMFGFRSLAYAGAFWMLAEGYVPGVFTDLAALVARRFSSVWLGRLSRQRAIGTAKTPPRGLMRSPGS